MIHQSPALSPSEPDRHPGAEPPGAAAQQAREILNRDRHALECHRESARQVSKRGTVGHAYQRGLLFLRIVKQGLHKALGYSDVDTCIRQEGGYQRTQRIAYCLVAENLDAERAEALADAPAGTVAEIFRRELDGQQGYLPQTLQQALLDLMEQAPSPIGKLSPEKMALVRHALLRISREQGLGPLWTEEGLLQAIEAALPTPAEEAKRKFRKHLRSLDRRGLRQDVLRDPEVRELLGTEEIEAAPGPGPWVYPDPDRGRGPDVDPRRNPEPRRDPDVDQRQQPREDPPAPDPAGEDRGSSVTELNGPSAPPPPRGLDPARKPDRMSPYQRDLPVGFADNDPDLTESERLMSCLIVGMTLLVGLTHKAQELWFQHEDFVSYRLCHRLCGTICQFSEYFREIGPRLEQGVQKGGEAVAQGFELPLPTDPDGVDLPMTWFSYQVIDPLHDPEPGPLERMLVHILCLTQALNTTVLDWLKQSCLGVLSSILLQYQFYQVWDECYGRLAVVLGMVAKHAEAGQAEEAQAEAERQLRRQQLQEARDRIWCAGEDRLPRQYTIIAITRDGDLVAVSQNTPQFLIILGRTGSGKTHIAMLILEGCVAPCEGLGEMVRPPRIVRFSSDYHQGVSGDELRAGFYPNTDPLQWEYLQRVHGIDRWDLCMNGSYLIGLPRSLPGFRQKYPDLIERGLLVQPLMLDPSEVGLFGYTTYLNGGAAARQREGQANYQKLIAGIIGWKGEDARPEVIRQELLKHKIDSGVQGTLLLQLQQLEEIIVPGAHLVRKLERGVPVMMHLEGRYIGAEQIGPLQVIASNALSRPLLNGEDPLRWHIHDEAHGDMVTAAGKRSMQLSGEQRRHRTTSHILAAQRASDLPRGVAPQATVVVQMGTDSEDEFRAAQRRFGVLHGISYHDEVRTLQDGQGLIGATRASCAELKKRAQMVNFRPSILEVRGETFEYVGDDDEKGEEE